MLLNIAFVVMLVGGILRNFVSHHKPDVAISYSRFSLVNIGLFLSYLLLLVSCFTWLNSGFFLG